MLKRLMRWARRRMAEQAIAYSEDVMQDLKRQRVEAVQALGFTFDPHRKERLQSFIKGLNLGIQRELALQTYYQLYLTLEE